ncbi:MAG TPA: DUF1269 domain-containing protein [Pyrinomonadaceae bacterium]|jgi:Predicted membrane protein|nr:DUF1269 domain-containing protein [Pyrinomonadaceae bacterium]
MSYTVSELIAFVFRDQFRAPEVLNELRRREWVWVRDLDEAVAVTMSENGKTRVHLTVDLSNTHGARWAKLWGSFLSLTLFHPMTEAMVEATSGLGFLPNRNHALASENMLWSPESEWWRKSLASSGNGNFKRDVGALMEPNGSAIFMLFRTQNAEAALKQLSNYGDTLVHTTLNSEQDKELLEMLGDYGQLERSN